jgi:hypothetical protein
VAVQAANELKQALLNAYGSFADKRIKNLDKGKLFIVDDRTSSDEDAAGKLFQRFCQILAEVIDDDNVKIIMTGDVPEGPLVARWFEQHGATKGNFDLEFIVPRGAETELGGLASGFRAMVRPGARYPVKSYKYVCPRAVGAIERLQRALETAWRSR